MDRIELMGMMVLVAELLLVVFLSLVAVLLDRPRPAAVRKDANERA